MSEVNRHLKDAGHQFADAAGNVSEGFGSAVNAATDCAQSTVQQLRAGAGRAVESVENKCNQAVHAARDTYEQGRDCVQHWEGDCRQAIRSSPFVSVLIAAGIGALLGIGIHWRQRGT